MMTSPKVATKPKPTRRRRFWGYDPATRIDRYTYYYESGLVADGYIMPGYTMLKVRGQNQIKTIKDGRNLDTPGLGNVAAFGMRTVRLDTVQRIRSKARP